MMHNKAVQTNFGLFILITFFGFSIAYAGGLLKDDDAIVYYETWDKKLDPFTGAWQSA